MTAKSSDHPTSRTRRWTHEASTAIRRIAENLLATGANYAEAERLAKRQFLREWKASGSKKSPTYWHIVSADPDVLREDDQWCEEQGAKFRAWAMEPPVEDPRTVEHFRVPKVAEPKSAPSSSTSRPASRAPTPQPPQPAPEPAPVMLIYTGSHGAVDITDEFWESPATANWRADQRRRGLL